MGALLVVEMGSYRGLDKAHQRAVLRLFHMNGAEVVNMRSNAGRGRILRISERFFSLPSTMRLPRWCKMGID